MSKVLERIGHKKTMELLDKHNILYKFKSAFRKNHSTNFCLPYLTDKTSKGFDFNNSMLMFMTNFLLLPIYNAKFHKDRFLDLCYFSCILTICHKDCYIFLNADDTSLLFQHKDLKRISKELTMNSFNMFDWFADNNLSIRFG